MKYSDLLTTVLSSSVEDWRSVPGRVTPHFVGEIQEGDHHWLKVSEHYSQWIFMPDVRISLAFGLPTSSDDPELEFEWRFPDPKAYEAFGDIRFNGSVVHRAHLLHVDGSRAVLPTPRNEVAPSGAPFGMERFAYSATESEVAFARLIDRISGHRSFDDYLRRAGIVALPDESEG
ncbi:hypothetical protein [Polymorphospora sp. NPDC050346]|uniref:hypothetical protein n=1 Tax=Polymorphospora sp. NPDC050346 TaxID=3155780 RepID=UPI00340CB8FB